MKRKAIAVWALMLALVMVVSACGSSGSGSGDKVTINMMHLWPEGSSKQQFTLVQEIIDSYEKEHKNVNIETEILENQQYKDKLSVLSGSDKLPDIGLSWAAGYLEPFIKGNQFATLDDLLAGDLKDKFVAGTTEAYAVDGKTYSLPLELNIVPVYYNKEIFAKNNLEVPQTWDDFKNVVKTLADKGITPITLGGKEGWTGSFWYMYLVDRLGGGDLLDNAIANNDFSDPKLAEAAKMLQELVDMNAFNKGFNGLSNDEAKAEFSNEKAAMYAMGTWEVPNYTTNEDVPKEFKDKVGFFRFPTVAGGAGTSDTWVGGPGVGLFVAEKSKVKDEAKKFVTYLIQQWGEKSVTEAGVIPATKVDTSKIDLPPLFIELLDELGAAKKVTLYADVQMKPGAAQEHYKLIQSLFSKEITPEDFAKKTDESLKAGK